MLAVVATGYPLQCGHPSGLVAVIFPASVGVPATIAPAAVHVNGVVPARVIVMGRTVTLQLPRAPGITCDSIAMGVLRITFSTPAHVQVGAATTAVVTHGTQRYHARISS